MRKGQAALEFLTTYGWAFLIILVMIGAIAYFGILNPSKFLPDRCQSSPEFNCKDYRIDATAQTIQYQLTQGAGKTIYLNGSSCIFQGVTPNIVVQATHPSIPASPNNAWSPRNAVSFTCDFSATAAALNQYRGKKFKVAYNVTYQTSSTGLTHRAEGEVYAEAQ
jgi:hypothetical protein